MEGTLFVTEQRQSRVEIAAQLRSVAEKLESEVSPSLVRGAGDARRA